MKNQNHEVLRKGKLRFALIGYAFRYLPAPIMQRLAARGAESSSGVMPPVPDLVRLLKASGGSLPGMSGGSDAFKYLPELAGVEIHDLDVGIRNKVPARLFQPPGKAAARAALVWVHGGAFLFGDLDMAESHWVGAALAARGIPVLTLDYRKSFGDNHFPAASDDVLAGWRWALEHLDRLGGVTAEQLHIGGASAGGNLVAGAVKRLRDGAGPLPASTFLAYPTVHAELPPWDPAELAAVQKAAGATFFAPEWVRDMRLNYIGDPALLDDPYAVPGNGDLGGQPRTFVLTCENDSLRSSGELYARQLTEAGVEVATHMVKGAVHGSLNAPFEAVGAESLEILASWLADGPDES